MKGLGEDMLMVIERSGGDDVEGEEGRIGKGTAKTTHIITKGLTLNPEVQHQNSPYCSQLLPSHITHIKNSPYCPQPLPSRFIHIRIAPIVLNPT